MAKSVKALSYNNAGQLCFYGKNIHPCLAKAQGHAFYLYSGVSVTERCQLLVSLLKKATNAPIKIHFAVKANPNLQLLNILKKMKIGADVVSGGELSRARQAGILSSNIIFSGVGKSETEIRHAIQIGIGQINVESLQELERIADCAKSLKKSVRIAFRVNPNVSPKTHPYIATGFKENKFGLSAEHLPKAIEILKDKNFQRWLDFQGFSLHIGSQLFDFSALEEAIEKVLQMEMDFIKAGIGIKSLDIGGGIGVQYDQDASQDLKTLADFCKVVSKKLNKYPRPLLFEPGRFLVARSGLLLARIEYLKETSEKKFVILNSGMNHFLRPALYQAEHRVFQAKLDTKSDKTNNSKQANKSRPAKTQKYDIVGPVCESSDVFRRNYDLQDPKQGQWLAIADVGAYGFSMASHYNLFPMPKEQWL